LKHMKKKAEAPIRFAFSTLKSIKDFAKAMENHIKNIYNCSYMCRLTARQLIDIVDFYGGTFIPAHVFTPYKSFYGNCCDSLFEIFDEKSFDKIPAVELGLSADS